MLVGNSLGGYNALATAARAPELVRWAANAAGTGTWQTLSARLGLGARGCAACGAGSAVPSAAVLVLCDGRWREHAPWHVRDRAAQVPRACGVCTPCDRECISLLGQPQPPLSPAMP